MSAATINAPGGVTFFNSKPASRSCAAVWIGRTGERTRTRGLRMNLRAESTMSPPRLAKRFRINKRVSGACKHGGDRCQWNLIPAVAVAVTGNHDEDNYRSQLMKNPRTYQCRHSSTNKPTSVSAERARRETGYQTLLRNLPVPPRKIRFESHQRRNHPG